MFDFRKEFLKTFEIKNYVELDDEIQKTLPPKWDNRCHFNAATEAILNGNIAIPVIYYDESELFVHFINKTDDEKYYDTTQGCIYFSENAKYIDLTKSLYADDRLNQLNDTLKKNPRAALNQVKSVVEMALYLKLNWFDKIRFKIKKYSSDRMHYV